VRQAHPTAYSLRWGSCPSGRRFAASFFQIRPRGRHPCFLAALTTPFSVRDLHPTNIQKLIQAFRRLGRPVVYTRIASLNANFRDGKLYQLTYDSEASQIDERFHTGVG